uniref:Uncharacterized protein n=1 Tax=Sparus aurata TaxID=8175 RepID=A0A671VPP1_SPAAU
TVSDGREQKQQSVTERRSLVVSPAKPLWSSCLSACLTYARPHPPTHTQTHPYTHTHTRAANSISVLSLRRRHTTILKCLNVCFHPLMRIHIHTVHTWDKSFLSALLYF